MTMKKSTRIHPIPVGFTTEEYEIVKENARRLGLSNNALIRLRVLGHVDVQAGMAELSLSKGPAKITKVLPNRRIPAKKR